MNKLISIHDDEFKRVEDNEKLVVLVSREYQRFLKDQREMTYRDWIIEKKLVEAGGLGRRVYIHVGRGNGKTATLIRHIEELESKGKEVCIVDYRNSSPRPKREDIDKLKECLLDWDLLANRDYGWRKPLYDTSFIWDTDREKERKKRQEFCVIPWEYLEHNLFKRQYLGKFQYKED